VVNFAASKNLVVKSPTFLHKYLSWGKTHNQTDHVLINRHAGERREKCTRFWWQSLKERDQSEDPGVDRRMVSEWILGRLGWDVWSGLNWIRIGTGIRLL
jgi:hypothetical protein